MNYPIIPLFAMTLLVAACANVPDGHGRYFQMYKNGAIAMEADAITNAGCRALINGLKKQEVSKESTPEETVFTCSSESTPRSALPVRYSWKYANDARTSIMWVWSMTACQEIASNAMKEDNNAKTACEVEKY